jgi:hypothetical protein
MTPELFRVCCPNCISTDEHVEARGPDTDIELCGGCSVCGFLLDEDIGVYRQVKMQIRLARQTPAERQRSILDGIKNLFTHPEYNDRSREIL